MLCVNPPRFPKTWPGLKSCRIAMACTEPAEPKCFIETHTRPRLLMHGVISASSSPEAVCMEQCEGRWGGIKRRAAKTRREQSTKSLMAGSSPPSNAHNRKNDVLSDTEVRLVTGKHLLGWLPSLCICRAWEFPGASSLTGRGLGLANLHPPAQPHTHTPGWTDSRWSHPSPLLGELLTAAPDQIKAFPNRIQVCRGPVLNFKAPDIFTSKHSHSNHLDNL